MAERLYIPSAYVDDTTPPGRASPNAWIGAAAGDVWLLATERDWDFDLTLRPGEVVPFFWVEDLGELLIAFRADGSHAVQGPVPPGVTHFTFGDDVLADSLDEFVREWKALVGVPAGGETVLARMSRWSPDDVLYQFDIGARGPRFICPPPPSRGSSEGGAP